MRHQIIFEDARRCNYGALRLASRRVSALYDRHLIAVGLTTGQYSILVEIGRLGIEERPTLSRLAEALVMDRSALTHTLKPLVRDGLVSVTKDRRVGADRRTRLIALTTKGRSRLEHGHRAWRQAQAEFEAGFGSQQATALRALLRLVLDAKLQSRSDPKVREG
jgi:DNA-binding MarR family transcriptional regulator